MKNSKPIGKKAYGSIPHLPASRLGPSDKQANPGQVKIATERPRRGDYIWVTEKLDGCNASVFKKNGELFALQKRGHLASISPFLQLKLWSRWVSENKDRFDALLRDGEWVVGEWCIQAHGTLYEFFGEPFFAFDLFSSGKRIPLEVLTKRISELKNPFEMPSVFFKGKYPVSVIDLLDYLEVNYRGHHGAMEPIEGAVWRIEHEGKVEFLLKYVTPDKVDGCYLPQNRGVDESHILWNWWGSVGSCIDELKDPNLEP
jgi:ATP-dependent RNA circularization protein (DNA/RNA ligase family)